MRALEHRQLGHRLLVARLGRAAHAVEPLLDRAEVGERELELDHLAVAHRVHRSHHVQHVVVVEAAHHVDDRVGLADVREELVAEPLALRRALHEPGDVDELDGGRHRALRLDDLRQRVESRVGHVDAAHVRLLGRERVVRGQHAGGGEGVEERRLADVGKADDAEFEHGAKGTEMGNRK